MSNTLELRVLDDEELMSVVGGGSTDCQPQKNPCERCDDDGLDIAINIDVVVCL